MSLLKYHFLSEAFSLPSVQFQNHFQLKCPHTITGPLFTDLAFPLCMYVCLTYHTFYLLTLIFVCLHHYEYKLHVVRDFYFFFPLVKELFKALNMHLPNPKKEI